MLPATTQTRDKKEVLEAIRDYLIDRRGHVKLTEKQQEIYVRLRAAWTLLSKFHSREVVAEILIKEHGVSLSQAQRDVLDSIALYGDTQQADKEGMRLIASEMAIATFAQAKKNDDFYGMNLATRNMIKIHGLDKANIEKPDFSKLQASITINILDDESKKALKRMIGKPGTIDLNDINTIDIEHEDVE